MFPAIVESARLLLDLASRAPEPVALLALGAALIALSYGFRSRPGPNAEPLSHATSKARSRIVTRSPLAQQHGRG